MKNRIIAVFQTMTKAYSDNSINDDGLRNAHLLLTKYSINNISLDHNDRFYMNIAPQLYFLNLDAVTGSYAALDVILGKRKHPVKLIGVSNFKLNSDVPTEDFFWNVTVRYDFR